MFRPHSLILCLFCFFSLTTYAKTAPTVNHAGSPSATLASTLAAVTIKSSTYTINPKHVVIASHTLLPGGPSVTINGEQVRLDSSGDLIADKATLYHHHEGSTKVSTAARSTAPRTSSSHSRASSTSPSTTRSRPKAKAVIKATTKPTLHPGKKSEGSTTAVVGPVAGGAGGVVPVIPVVPPGLVPKKPELPSPTTPSLTKSSSSASTASTSCDNSATACGSCNFIYDSYPVVDDATQQRRAVAGRILVEKRAPPAPTNIIGGKMCSVATYTPKPAYPAGYQITSAEAVPTPSMDAFFHTGTYWAVTTARVDCAPPGWAYRDTAQVLADGYSIGGSNGKTVNIDHVYEKGTLDEFFQDQISAGFTCPNVQALFDPINTMSAGTRLNTIFAQLASFEHPDFLGMDAGLNGLKGSLWNPGLQGIRNHKGNPNTMLSLLGNIAIVMSIVQDPKVKKLFENTNTRIYQAFQGIDALLKKRARCGDPITLAGGGGPMSATWAPAYSSWIANKVSSQNALIISTASALSSSILQYQAKNNVAGNTLPTAFHSFTKAYEVNSMKFNYDLTGLVGAPLIINRDQQACTPSSILASITESHIATKSSPKAASSPVTPSTTSSFRYTFSSVPGEPTPPPIPVITNFVGPSRTIPSLPPPLPRPSNAIRIYNYADCATSPCNDTSHVYDIAPGGTGSPCSDPGIFSQSYNPGPGSNLAVRIGPFNSHGLAGCLFSGTSSSGSLNCPGLAGRNPIHCVVPKVPMNVNCPNLNAAQNFDFTWEIGYCEW